MNISEMTANLLAAHNVKTVVASPGSRNAPLVKAFDCHPDLRMFTVVDERAAGFVALGISLTLGQPVALVCSSGSAMLNLAPALAEAYYRRVPIIVISADRPAQWIDQNDSQTLRQNGALNAVVAKSFDVTDDDLPEGAWVANRLINEALLTVKEQNRPVHINVHLDFRNSSHSDAVFSTRLISLVSATAQLPTQRIRELAAPMHSPTKVMVVAGFMRPDAKLNRAMARLASRPNVVVVAESLSNLHAPGVLICPDLIINLDLPEELMPDVVISTGGALVSEKLKGFLRKMPKSIPVWHVGEEENIVDCFKHLSTVIDLPPNSFFPQFASAMNKPGQADSAYSSGWNAHAQNCYAHRESIVRSTSWNALQLFHDLVAKIPRRWNVHVSNGMSIRYMQLFDCSALHRCECNRGVSGIDGTTMTALGASVAYKDDCTLLITGDMSLLYDMGWINSPLLTPRFKILMVENAGGNIFRMVKSTVGAEDRDERFVVTGLPSPILPAQAAGWKCFEANSREEFENNFAAFAAESSTPALLVVHTPPETDIQIYKELISK